MIPNFCNLVLCLGLAWSAMCRLSMMDSERVRLAPAWMYVALFVVSLVSGLQFFLFGTLATWASVVLSGLACVFLACTVTHWRHGMPLQLAKGAA